MDQAVVSTQERTQASVAGIVSQESTTTTTGAPAVNGSNASNNLLSTIQPQSNSNPQSTTLWPTITGTEEPVVDGRMFSYFCFIYSTVIFCAFPAF
jgi:hypothetical protein